MKLTQEQISKMKDAKTAEELLTFAKENGIELTEEEAKNYFEQWHKEGEIADEELDSVAGGTCYSSGVTSPWGKAMSYAIVSPVNICPYDNQMCEMSVVQILLRRVPCSRRGTD